MKSYAPPKVRIDLHYLSREVTRHRAKAMLSQSALAELCGVTLKQINNIECARNGASIDLYLALCHHLKLEKPPMLRKAA